MFLGGQNMSAFLTIQALTLTFFFSQALQIDGWLPGLALSLDVISSKLQEVEQITWALHMQMDYLGDGKIFLK